MDLGISADPPASWLQFRREREDGGEGTCGAGWERLRPADERALQARYAAQAEGGVGGLSRVPVLGGRWEAVFGSEGEEEEKRSDSRTPSSARSTAEAEAAVVAALEASALALKMGSLLPRYYEERPRHLVRSVWCYRYWPNGAWTPFAHGDDLAIEEMWQRLSARANEEGGEVKGLGKPASTGSGSAASPRAVEPEEHRTADGQYVVRMSQQPDGKLIVSMRAVDGSWNPFKMLSWYAHRGWAGAALSALTEQEAEYEARAPEALVLVVHGMGEAFWSTHKSIGSIRDACATMRSLAAAIDTQGAADAGGQGGKKGSSPAVNVAMCGQRAGRVEFLPIEWHMCLRDLGNDSMQTLLSVTPPSVPFLRQIANDVVMDVLFYQQDDHRRHMQKFVADRMNKTVAAWRQHNPSFNGPIVILGHSLGSLICFDLLDDETDLATSTAATPSPSLGTPALDFRPEAFVGIGSPVGCFASLRGAPLGPAFQLGRTDRYFNVYHRNDVVAYRIEPLLVKHGEKAAHPAYVPFFGGGADGKRLHVKLKQTVRSVAKAAESVQSWISSGSIKDKIVAAAQAIDGATLSSFSQPAENEQETAAAGGEVARHGNYLLNRGEPIDWVLQETEFEAANEYLSAAAAHTSYFDNADVAAFLLRHVLSGVSRTAPSPVNRRESM